MHWEAFEVVFFEQWLTHLNVYCTLMFEHELLREQNDKSLVKTHENSDLWSTLDMYPITTL